jgi:hypothetical protein
MYNNYQVMEDKQVLLMTSKKRQSLNNLPPRFVFIFFYVQKNK